MSREIEIGKSYEGSQRFIRRQADGDLYIRPYPADLDGRLVFGRQIDYHWIDGSGIDCIGEGCAQCLSGKRKNHQQQIVAVDRRNVDGGLKYYNAPMTVWRDMIKIISANGGAVKCLGDNGKTLYVRYNESEEDPKLKYSVELTEDDTVLNFDSSPLPFIPFEEEDIPSSIEVGVKKEVFKIVPSTPVVEKAIEKVVEEVSVVQTSDSKEDDVPSYATLLNKFFNHNTNATEAPSYKVLMDAYLSRKAKMDALNNEKKFSEIIPMPKVFNDFSGKSIEATRAKSQSSEDQNYKILLKAYKKEYPESGISPGYEYLFKRYHEHLEDVKEWERPLEFDPNFNMDSE